jgi:hypothetical protein
MEEIKDYLQDFFTRDNNEETINNFFEFLALEKISAIKSQNEDLANQLWLYETILNIQSYYLRIWKWLTKGMIFEYWINEWVEKTYHNPKYLYGNPINNYNYNYRLTQRNLLYFNAWEDSVNSEEFANRLKLARNINNIDNYCLGFIDRQIEMIQGVFPYFFFSSIGMKCKDFQCNICGNTSSPRNFCGHHKGYIYIGKRCIKRPQKIDKLDHFAFVPNPRDKRLIVPSETLNKHHNYENVSKFIHIHQDPFKRIYYSWIYELIKKKRDKIRQLDELTKNTKKEKT